MSHISVLKDEAIAALNIKDGGHYVDGTLGRGGHALEICERMGEGHLTCFDLDESAITQSQKTLKPYLSQITLIHDNFKNMDQYLNQSVDGILLDLGVSSPQFDEAERGFSYRYDADLDMRMNQKQELSAKDVINTYDEADLKRVIATYGEERFASRIARKIVEGRPIESTLQLVEVIKSALPNSILRQKGHPAKKTFQAIRIEVNQELNSLQEILDKAPSLLKPKGILVIISFHSLEDRLVKEAFKALSKPPKTDRRLPELITNPPQFETKLIKVSQQEVQENIRAHSAKMRILIRKEPLHG